MIRNQSPPVQLLRSIVAKDWSLPVNSYDEVYPGILLGNALVIYVFI
jgi:aspartokinase-like uncharacterized kinase